VIGGRAGRVTIQGASRCLHDKRALCIVVRSDKGAPIREMGAKIGSEQPVDVGGHRLNQRSPIYFVIIKSCWLRHKYLPLGSHLRYSPNMPKSIRAIPKKRGRPSTGGRDPLYAVRIHDALVLAVDRWAAENGSPSRSDALRRLIELGLSFSKTVPKAKH
jgi:hypothetical protein